MSLFSQKQTPYLNYNLTTYVVLKCWIIISGINMTRLTSNSLHDKIISKLTHLQLYARLHNNAVKTDCENVFKEIFNVLYGLNLVNANLNRPNYPAADLVDKSQGVCYQITVQKDITSKITETINAYKKHGLDKLFPELRIFFFMDSPIKRPKEKGVFFLPDLVNHIKCNNIQISEEILSILNRYVLPLIQEPKCVELESIKNVIEYLSSQDTVQQCELEIKPTPEAKLNLRFGNDEAILLQKEYAELFFEYSELLEMAKRLYITDGTARKIKLHLNRCSRKYLQECSGNGEKALDTLIEKITKPTSYSSTAVRFYILSELMECDVFPLSDLEARRIEVTV